VVGAANPERLETALAAFEAQGFARVRDLNEGQSSDQVVGLLSGAPEMLRQADAVGIAYVLVHHGPDDGVAGGTYERAHHRVEVAELPQLARRLRSREGMLVTCLAFAFRQGIPAESAWVIDARFLENPFWVPELRELDGLDARVRDYVMGQPAATALLDGLESTLRSAIPAYRARGRMELTIAFGCTGGRHRSVVLAAEMGRRLTGLEGIDVEFRARDL
jgi:hypothetical protein